MEDERNKNEIAAAEEPILPGGKPKRKAGLLDILIVTTGVLTVLLVVLLLLRWYDGKRAESAANTVLDAFTKAQSSATPTPMPEETGTPEPTVPPVTPPPGADAEDYADLGTPGPEITPSPEEAAALAATEAHRLADDSENVDETANYVQPDAPEIAVYNEANEKALEKLGQDGVIGIIEIPEISVKLPVLGKWSYSLLKISVCRYLGPGVNEPGNLVILGHNYKSGAHFGKLDKLAVGSEVLMTGADGKSTTYTVYEISSVGPDDINELNAYRGECGLTLVTCTKNGTLRRVVRCEKA